MNAKFSDRLFPMFVMIVQLHTLTVVIHFPMNEEMFD